MKPLIVLALAVAVVAAAVGTDHTTTTLSQPATEGTATMVTVRLMGPDGELTAPTEVPKLVLSDAEWRARLTPEQYRILRNQGTEPAFCGGLLNNKEPGVYACIGCSLPLFASDAEFESGTGWPSFFQPIAAENVVTRLDDSYGMVRTELLCARCDGHLGHVFEDGPPPTGLRYCMNSEVLRFVPDTERASLAETLVQAAAAAPAVPPLLQVPEGLAEAVFAGGCFWCVEAVFEEIEGVVDAMNGYAGGDAATANYKDVCTGQTGHAEAVRILYDPKIISYEQLLEVHFSTHDPTTLNRQGADVGPQYRSAIFYHDEAEKQRAEAFVKKLEAEGRFRDPIVTTFEPLDRFYPAEQYHQDYARLNPMQMYIQAVAQPKVEKTREKFSDLLKTR